MSSGFGSSKDGKAKVSKPRSDPSSSKDMRPVFAFGNRLPTTQKAQIGKQKLTSANKPSGAVLDDAFGAHEPVSDSEQQPVPTLSILDLPDNVTEHLFTFVSVTDLKQCALVCKQWNAILSDENNEVWRANCYRRLSRDVIHSELLSSCPTYKSKLRAFFHAWNPHDCSRNVFVKPSGFTIHRNPVAQSTDGARGKIGKYFFQ